MMGRPVIPFHWWPGHWGLKGKTKELAMIDYEIDDPYKRDIARAKLEYTNKKLLDAELLAIDFRYKKLTEKEYDLACIDSIQDETEKKLKTVEYLFSKGEITEIEHDKELATINGVPWFHLDMDYIQGELVIKVDCNSGYIEFLRSVGYGSSSETSDDDVIDEYVRDCGRKISSDDIADEFSEQLGYSFVKSTVEDDGTTSYQ